MPIQNCSLIRGIRIYSEDLQGGNVLIGSEFSQSICRSVIEENGRDVIWGKAEEEIDLIIRLHVRKILGRSILIKNVRIHWDEMGLPDGEEESPRFRRSDYKAVFLNDGERTIYNSINEESGKFFDKYCTINADKDGGSYLVCKKMPPGDWDALLVKLTIRRLPFRK